MVQSGISTQTGSEILTDCIINLQKQLREVKKLVLGTRAQGLDGPVHNNEPGDYVYVRSLSDSPLEPKCEGPFHVLLTTYTAVKIKEQESWIHHTRIKTASRPRSESAPAGPLKLWIQRKDGQ